VTGPCLFFSIPTQTARKTFSLLRTLLPFLSPIVFFCRFWGFSPTISITFSLVFRSSVSPSSNGRWAAPCLIHWQPRLPSPLRLVHKRSSGFSAGPTQFFSLSFFFKTCPLQVCLPPSFRLSFYFLVRSSREVFFRETSSPFPLLFGFFSFDTHARRAFFRATSFPRATAIKILQSFFQKR